ncbi:hypothetical protein [Paludisphaera borealis]|uniref:Lipoprotein n=1 Tax=Paludisphaera borealis TaxID=1387353 RepID=A0A1U7CZ40_9BACT|nr:hypothetical protein [Paludisphaera borealis]APW64153.1 hypothetical protein BSF38_05745 [Paludisphaera borealis]
MTRFLVGLIAVLSIAPLSGCGGGPLSTSNPGQPPPHGGSLIHLPDGEGFVEVVKKEAGGAKASVDKEASFYFLKDMTTPLSPAPAAGTITIGKKKVELKADGEALVTPSGPPIFPSGGLDGVLTVEIGGKSRNIPLDVR